MNAKSLTLGGFVAMLIALGLVLHLVPPLRNGLAGMAQPFLRGMQAMNRSVAVATTRIPLSESERARLRRLEQEVETLRVNAAQGRQAVEELRELQQFLDLGETADWRIVAAPVIARDPLTWSRGFRVGKGIGQGVRLGAAVVAGGGVIGRVTTVGAGTAEVSTLLSPDCALSVQLQECGAVGVMNGRADTEGNCLVDYLPRDSAYQAGEAVRTSGLSDVIPGGLPVGVVAVWDEKRTARIVDSAGAQLRLRPAAPADGFRYVLVICKGP